VHKSRLGGFIIDCETDNLDEAERFWTRALGYASEISSDPADEGYVALKTAPDEPLVSLQKVSHPSRVHIDIEADDVEAEVARLESLGAKKIEKIRTWWVMEAPTGHRFCVVVAGRSDFDERANNWK
jgi:predicted enzyme related to lactoylglutathione lyase